MKIGILISGRGSNMVAIVEAVQSGQIPDSEVVVVICDRSSADGIQKALDQKIETIVVMRRAKTRTREEHDAEMIAELKKRGVELVCLAGYMRLLSKEFVRTFPNKILNIHPSLLPSFPGLDAQQQALDYGVKISGCTVHFVDEHLDHGAIILQKAVQVKDDDTAPTLSERILEHEHKLYIKAIKNIVEDKIKIDGRIVKEEV
jgi:phosphoribosylglycinamide formyltransferase 1